MCSPCTAVCARRLLQLAVPLIVQNIFGYGITLVGVITVGHLGTYELSASILGSSAMNITGFAFLVRCHKLRPAQRDGCDHDTSRHPVLVVLVEWACHAVLTVRHASFQVGLAGAMETIGGQVLPSTPCVEPVQFLQPLHNPHDRHRLTTM